MPITETKTASSDFAEAGSCPVHFDFSDHHGYQPFDQKNPFPAYAQLRQQEPVMFDERTGYYVVTRYDDVKQVFNQWETFSSENAQAPVRERGAEAKRIMEEGGFTAYSGLSARTPPTHTRLRKIAQHAFTPRRYRVLEPTIRENTRGFLREMLKSEDRRGDFLAGIAYHIPTITILTLLGVDTAMVPTYKRWSDSRGAMTWGALSDEAQVPHAHNLVEYWQECQRLVAVAHEQGGDNLIADLVRAQDEGAEISDHEIASLCYSLLFAGHETTTTLISNAVRVLLGHPEAWQRVVADPSIAPQVLEEVLRYSGSITAWRRKALKDTEVGGVSIPAGSGLLLVMGSANRDESIFERPDEFDIDRENASNHVSFGFGIHYCLGNLLARLQAKVVLEETVAMVPTLRLQDGADINFRENLSFRVPTSVPVTWEA